MVSELFPVPSIPTQCPHLRGREKRSPISSQPSTAHFIQPLPVASSCCHLSSHHVCSLPPQMAPIMADLLCCDVKETLSSEAKLDIIRNKSAQPQKPLRNPRSPLQTHRHRLHFSPCFSSPLSTRRPACQYRLSFPQTHHPIDSPSPCTTIQFIISLPPILSWCMESYPTHRFFAGRHVCPILSG